LRTATILNLKIFRQLQSAFARRLLTLVFLGPAAAHAQTTNGMTDAETQGRQLAQLLCNARPETNFTQTGVLQIRDGQGGKTNFLIKCEAEITPESWKNIYYAYLLNGNKTNNWNDPHVEITEITVIIHTIRQPNQYKDGIITAYVRGPIASSVKGESCPISNEQATTSFANSDFWLCDLGLEFFHWPQQKLLPKKTTVKRGRDYTLLESTNPNPPTNGYSRVLSWIDKESGGILEAEVYDAQGKLLKEFEPKSFKKVNGQWELQEMEIRNVQTGSRTRIEFDLKSN
jgi:Outer membrane lipoprotein-sorting protein